MAKKHKDEMAKAKYHISLSQAPAYARNPTPPIITESVFGHLSPSPLTVTNSSMDIDNVPFTPNTSPPPLVAHLDENFSKHYHMIPDNNFQANTNLDDLQCKLEPYNEDFELTAVEDELCAFSEIRYSSLSNVPKYGWHVEVLIDFDRGKHPCL